MIQNRGEVCTSCVLGKHSPSLGGKRYILLIMDDFLRFTWVALLKDKSDAFAKFRRFKSLAEAEKGVEVK